VLLHVALDVLVAAVLKVEIELADSKSSWIFAMFSAGACFGEIDNHFCCWEHQICVE